MDDRVQQILAESERKFGTLNLFADGVIRDQVAQQVSRSIRLAAEAVADAEGQVRVYGQQVKSVVDRVVSNLESDRSLNSLGELQRVGQLFDTWVVLLAERRKTLESQLIEFVN